MSVIPDLAVEAAAEVLWGKEMNASWSSAADGFKAPFLRDARQAIEAAAPHLLAGSSVDTVEELEGLPIGSVVLAGGYLHHANGMPVAFQRWTGGEWHRGARSSSTHPDNIVPATVLHRGAP